MGSGAPLTGHPIRRDGPWSRSGSGVPWALLSTEASRRAEPKGPIRERRAGTRDCTVELAQFAKKKLASTRRT